MAPWRGRACRRGFQHWISTDDQGDYSNFLISKGIAPDKPNGRFSEVGISNLPIELSRPKFLEKHACEFIEKHQRDPFILVVAFVEPHSPYNGPLNDVNPLDEVDLDATATLPEREDIPLRYRLMREWQQAEALVGSGAAADSVVLRDYTRRIPQHQATLPRPGHVGRSKHRRNSWLSGTMRPNGAHNCDAYERPRRQSWARIISSGKRRCSKKPRAFRG